MRKTLLALGLFFMLLGAAYLLKGYYGVDLIKAGHPGGPLGKIVKSFDVLEFPDSGTYVWKFGWDRLGRFTSRRWAQQQHLLTAQVDGGSVEIVHRGDKLWSVDDRKTLRVVPSGRYRITIEAVSLESGSDAYAGLVLLSSDLRQVVAWKFQETLLDKDPSRKSLEFSVPDGVAGVRLRVYGRGAARVIVSHFALSEVAEVRV